MAEKKKLHLFLSDMLKVSCVKGFKHFAIHMRGREEMICSIINEPSVPIILSAANSPAASFARQRKEALPMSHKQQRRLSGYGFINVGLPPASPSESEDDGDDKYTMFLVAAYSRYNRPYVWIRTNHERLVRLVSEEEKDYPLLLQSTSQWQEKDIKVWDILSEMVQVCSAPCPPNPFSVDMDYFQSLAHPERALASAAMMSFLKTLLASGSHPYDRRVQTDLLQISQLHFQTMLNILQEKTLQVPPSSSSSASASSTQHPYSSSSGAPGEPHEHSLTSQTFSSTGQHATPPSSNSFSLPQPTTSSSSSFVPQSSSFFQTHTPVSTSGTFSSSSRVGGYSGLAVGHSATPSNTHPQTHPHPPSYQSHPPPPLPPQSHTQHPPQAHPPQAHSPPTHSSSQPPPLPHPQPCLSHTHPQPYYNPTQYASHDAHSTHSSSTHTYTPTANVQGLIPTANVQGLTPIANVQGLPPTANVQGVTPIANVQGLPPNTSSTATGGQFYTRSRGSYQY